jgi:PAS domain S-box-containing protein
MHFFHRLFPWWFRASRRSRSRWAERMATLRAENTALGEQIARHQRENLTAAQLAAIVESSSDAIVGRDLEGHVTSWNASAEGMFGYPASEMLGQSIRRIIPADRQILEEQIATRVKRGGPAESFETQRLYANGRRIDVSVTLSPIKDPDGQVVGASHVFRDITERKRIEARFRRLVDSNVEGVLFWNSHGGVTGANDAFLHLVGYTREDMEAGRINWGAMTPPEFAEVDRRALVELAARGVHAAYEKEFIRKDGGRTPILIGAASFEDNPQEGVCFVVDMTERKQADARVRAQEEADRANRAKSEFLSRTSHELRTPLHAILGFAQLLEMDGLDLEGQESVAQIIRAGKHLLGLINEVLDIARVESGKLALTPEAVSVRETLEGALSLVQPLADERRVRLEPLTGDLDCEALASDQHFTQVVLNLLSNAVKYNREGGTVAVSCEKMAACLRIQVADTGPGISAANLAKLFVPFERLNLGDTVIEGTGLGLSLSKHLVEAMGGRIGVESVLDKGATFWVELPLIPRRSAASRKSLDALIDTVAELPRGAAPRTLLYIEDNLSNLRLVERILARRPEVKLISAMQGRIGLELARQHPPDLLLLDLHLPDIPGDEILRQWRADPRLQQIPVVMISADATDAQIARLRASGADGYLTKPIDVRQFLAVVDGIEPRRPESVQPPGAPVSS